MSTTEIFNERFNANLPLMHHARFFTAAAVVGKNIYIAGGLDAGRNIQSTAECYDTDTQRWNETNSMRTKRYGHAAVPLGNSIVVMGGVRLSSAEQYNTATGQWSTFPSTNEVRCYCAAAVLNGRIIVVGGRDRKGRALSSAEEYDPATGR
eukprot:1698035-Ditylum_brightwellii.AAC.1